MTDAQFPSGPWTGCYNYRAGGERYRMDMTLTFKNGRIDGEGGDGVGLFVVSGYYDPEAGECWWTKGYVGAHDVAYHGFREGRRIWGTWVLTWAPVRPGGTHGGFQIWPVGEEPAEEAVATKEQRVPAAPVRLGAGLGE